MAVQALKPQHSQGGGKWIFVASLVYIVSSRPARAVIVRHPRIAERLSGRNPVLTVPSVWRSLPSCQAHSSLHFFIHFTLREWQGVISKDQTHLISCTSPTGKEPGCWTMDPER